MLRFYKIALAPLLLFQGRRVRQTALRLPEASGPRNGTAGSSGEPLRVLFIGDSSAAGVGVAQQSEAMPYQAATDAARLLGRAVEWRSIAASGANTSDALQLYLDQPAEPADIVITALGVNDATAQRTGAQFSADYQQLLEAVADRSGAHLTIVSGLPPMEKFAAIPQPLRWYLGNYARNLDQALQALCNANPRIRFLPLAFQPSHEMARDGFHPGKAQYRDWAHAIAAEIKAAVAPG